MEAAVLNLGAESRSSTEENIHFIFFFCTPCEFIFFYILN